MLLLNSHMAGGQARGAHLDEMMLASPLRTTGGQALAEGLQALAVSVLLTRVISSKLFLAQIFCTTYPDGASHLIGHLLVQ